MSGNNSPRQFHSRDAALVNAVGGHVIPIVDTTNRYATDQTISGLVSERRFSITWRGQKLYCKVSCAPTPNPKFLGLVIIIEPQDGAPALDQRELELVDLGIRRRLVQSGRPQNEGQKRDIAAGKIIIPVPIYTPPTRP